MKPVVVLVHGASRGAWCWDRLVPVLRGRGIEVHAPTLTGLADRDHLLDATVGLRTHVSDVLGVLRAHELDGVTLVGHSYGTMVVAGVLGRDRSRIARVVLLDGPVPLDGESGASLHPRGAEFVARAVERDGVPVIPPAFRPDPRFDDETNAWMARRVTPHPLRCTTDPLHLPGGWPRDLDKHYVRCLPAGEEPGYLSRVRPEDGWELHQIESHHDLMVHRPDRLADLLAGLCSTAHTAHAEGQARPDGRPPVPTKGTST